MKKGLDHIQNDQVNGLPQYKLHLKALNNEYLLTIFASCKIEYLRNILANATFFSWTATLHLVPEHLPLKIEKKKNIYICVCVCIYQNEKRSSNNRKRH